MKQQKKFHEEGHHFAHIPGTPVVSLQESDPIRLSTFLKFFLWMF